MSIVFLLLGSVIARTYVYIYIYMRAWRRGSDNRHRC